MDVGGEAPVIAVVHNDAHLKDLLVFLHKEDIQFVLLGGGSNVIFADSFSVPDLTVIANRTSNIEISGPNLVKVNSGVLNSALMAWNIMNGIGGMDFLAGIPGTIGGAAAVNAGAFGQSISTILKQAEIVDKDGNVRMVDNDYFEFQYRNSKFKYGDEVIINVFLEFVPEPTNQVKEKVNARITYRKEKHPCSTNRSAGCFFKNPIIEGQKTSAGKLIEQTGFKGKIYETLRVAKAHANFIINKGTATFSDIQALEQEIVKSVASQQGITLEREVIYITPNGQKK
jgi:UDP-N-acetylmuramate dehydrogenase